MRSKEELGGIKNAKLKKEIIIAKTIANFRNTLFNFWRVHQLDKNFNCNVRIVLHQILIKKNTSSH